MSSEVNLSVEFRELLACPKDKGPLIWLSTQALAYNPRLRLVATRSGKASRLLVSSEAVEVDADWHRRLMAGDDGARERDACLGRRSWALAGVG